MLTACVGSIDSKLRLNVDNTPRVWHNAANPLDVDGDGIGGFHGGVFDITQWGYTEEWQSVYDELTTLLAQVEAGTLSQQALDEWRQARIHILEQPMVRTQVGDDIVCDVLKTRQQMLSENHTPVDWFEFEQVSPHITTMVAALGERPENIPYFLDVNGDGYLTKMDCQLVLAETFGQYFSFFRDAQYYVAQELDSMVGLYQGRGGYAFNRYGIGDKSLYDAWGNQYLLIPGGSLKWLSPSGDLVHIETFGDSVYESPLLLHGTYNP